ncbi:MAG: polyphenol oxidase family protein [Spirochaetaceae bacterium]
MIRTLALEVTGKGPVRLPFGLPVYLTLREDGDMGPSGARVQNRRDGVLRRLGVDPGRYVTVRQVHSREVQIVSRERSPADVGEADGLLSDDDGLALGVTVADCVPVFLNAPRAGVFGVLHSGWRGTGIAAEAVRLIGHRFGVSPEEISAMIGPSIGPCCYEVDGSRAKTFAGAWGADTVIEREGSFYLDLRRANAKLLAAEGVTDVSVVDACTACSPRLGSYRREGADAFTRMMAVIVGSNGVKSIEGGGRASDAGQLNSRER